MVGCAGILVSDTLCGPLHDLPRPGQLLAVDALPTKVGGCAANVAIGLAKQSIDVEIAGCLGSDSVADGFIAEVAKYGIGTERISYSRKLPTSRTVILLVEGEDRRYVHSFGANAEFTVAHIDREWVKSLDVFYLGGLFLMPGFKIEEFVDLLGFCRQQKVVSVVDVVIPTGTGVPKNIGSLISGADYFLPNTDEAALLTGTAEPLEQLRLFTEMGAHTAMITLGEKGAVVSRDGRYWKAGTYTVGDVVDPSGSGDAFTTGVIAGVVAGWDLPRTMRLASALGASACRALGTTDGVFTREQAETHLASHELPVETGAL